MVSSDCAVSMMVVLSIRLRWPGEHRIERSLLQGPLGGVALHFAARGFGQRAGTNQRHGRRGDLVVLGDGGADRHHRCVRIAELGLVDLGHDGQCVGGTIVGGDGERRHAPSPNPGDLLNQPFDVLGVQVAATDDDQVLDAPGHVQLAIVEESQVARAQKGALARVQLRFKDLPGLTATTPVPPPDAWSAQPDLADLAIVELNR